MDLDASTKFIGSLTKFLQSLCNGYVEFQKGVELVGHIYLSIDTGEKVDYVLHEKVNKSDENSVTFVSNSFHAMPPDKEKGKSEPSKANAVSKNINNISDDDDIVILDSGASRSSIGSTNSGTIPSRKRSGSPDQRQMHKHVKTAAGQSSIGRGVGSSRHHSGVPSATVSSQGLDINELKLEQISNDELLSLASQVGEGHSRPSVPRSQVRRSGASAVGGAGDATAWIKQEAPDNPGGDADSGWSQGRDESNSNSGSNLYPVMLHTNTAAAYSNPPVFPGTSFANPMPGTSQDVSGLDPSDYAHPWTECEKGDTTEKQMKSRIYESKRRREFVSSWATEFPWLVYNEEKKKMYCRICLKYPGNASKRSNFVLGNSSFRKLNLQHHDCSTKHQMNLAAYMAEEHDEDTTLMQKQVYTLGEEISTSVVQDMVDDQEASFAESFSELEDTLHSSTLQDSDISLDKSEEKNEYGLDQDQDETAQ